MRATLATAPAHDIRRQAVAARTGSVKPWALGGDRPLRERTGKRVVGRTWTGEAGRSLAGVDNMAI